MDADPSIDLIMGPYAAAIHHYLRDELRSELDLPYAVFSDAIEHWSYQEFEGRPVNVVDKLERVMRAGPHLRVRIEYGYYDLATPYAAAEDMVAHLRLPASALERIEHAWFETGHMPYLGEGTRGRGGRGDHRLRAARERPLASCPSAGVVVVGGERDHAEEADQGGQEQRDPHPGQGDQAEGGAAGGAQDAERPAGA